MKENEWIKIEDSLPGIGQEIEIKFKGGAQRLSFLRYQNDNFLSFLRYQNDNLLSFHDYRDGGYWSTKYITHWRPLPEKRPDFSKLVVNDLILIDYSYNILVGLFGFVDKIDDNSIYTSHKNEHRLYSDIHLKDRIKKITRINLKEKTFEEI